MTNLLMHLCTKGIKDFNLKSVSLMVIGECSNICEGRQRILDTAVKFNMTHLLILDDDTTFPYDMLDLMFARKVLPLGVNLAFKSARSPLGMGTAKGMNGSVVNTLNRMDTEPVEFTTMACSLYRVADLAKLPRPAFQSNELNTDDHHFHKLLNSHGFQMHVDHLLSKVCGHIGERILYVETY